MYSAEEDGSEPTDSAGAAVHAEATGAVE